ncbi:MAG: HEAT repeat domain-containing protein, partial [Lachnospiraceae bacterium]|nr:HEAT repeat domain-containing protein [Lachnospiraceae bacterium]
MIKDFYYNIVNGLNVKENLLSLKETLKTPIKGSREKDALLSILNGDFSVLTELLKNEDPKIRKNTAIVLGILEAPENLDALYEAYTTDIVMYNKATYVEALRKIGYEKYKEELKARFEELKKIPVDDENRKHVVDEMKQLVKIFGNGKLVFAGFSLENECIFTTNRSHKEVTGDQLKKLPHKDFPSGIIFKTKALEDVIHIRTYDELLFVPDGARTVSADPKKAAKELFDAGIKEYIFKRVLIKGEEAEQSSG